MLAGCGEEVLVPLPQHTPTSCCQECRQRLERPGHVWHDTLDSALDCRVNTHLQLIGYGVCSDHAAKIDECLCVHICISVTLNLISRFTASLSMMQHYK